MTRHQHPKGVIHVPSSPHLAGDPRLAPALPGPRAPPAGARRRPSPLRLAQEQREDRLALTTYTVPTLADGVAASLRGSGAVPGESQGPPRGFRVAGRG